MKEAYLSVLLPYIPVVPEPFSPFLSKLLIKNATPQGLDSCTSYPFPFSFLQILHNKAPKILALNAGPQAQDREGNKLIEPT